MKLEFIEMVENNEQLGGFSIYLKPNFEVSYIKDETACIEVLVNKQGKPVNAFLLDEGFLNLDYELIEVEKQKCYDYIEDLKVFHIVEF